VTLDQLLPKWLKWLETIEGHVRSMLSDRYIFREVIKIVEANPKTHDPNDFVMWFVQQYVEAASIRVRRLVDRDDRTVSLRRLLKDIEDHADAITRKWFVQQFTQDHLTGDEPRDSTAIGMAHGAFDRWSGKGKGHADFRIVMGHRRQLEDACKAIHRYVDKRIAHHDAIPTETLPLPTWGDLDRAIDTIDKKTCRCIALLRQAGVKNGSLTETWQYEWTNVFEHPWKPPR